MSDFSKPELRRADDAKEDWRIYRGTSMLRVFVPGDLLQTEKLSAAQAEAGDIIAFDTPRGGVTVHRVIERMAGGRLRTMGDNNPRPDAETLSGLYAFAAGNGLTPAGATLPPYGGRAYFALSGKKSDCLAAAVYAIAFCPGCELKGLTPAQPLSER